MPFQSKAQQRWMFANKPRMAKRWAKETENIKALPEKVSPKSRLEKLYERRPDLKTKNATIEKTAFWQGFLKQADSFGEGGSGFSGVGKGNILGQLEADERQGPVNRSKPGGDDTTTDKTLLDRERNPRDYSIFNNGPDFINDNIPQLIT